MLLSLLRGMAALNVAAAHLRAQLYPGFALVDEPPLAFKGIAFFAGFAHLSVVIFFVLSGWLVGGSLLNRFHDERAISNYAIDRITRLWIVLVPVFVVSLLCGHLMGMIEGGSVDLGFSSEFSLGTFLGNLVGLQDIFVSRYGGNFALWSLTNEIWYYIMFPLLIVMLRGQRVALRVMCALLLIAIAKLVGGAILAYFSIWLLGALFSRIRTSVSTAIRRLLLCAVICIAVYFRLRGYVTGQSLESFGQDFSFALAFLIWFSTMQFEAPRSSRAYRLVDHFGKFFASFSFTLYVLHVPLILVIRHYLPSELGVTQLVPHNAAHYLVYFTCLTAIIVASYLMYLPFEANTQRLRNWIKGLFTIRPVGVRVH
jgi:peptidoglycan/LPS O-acetylase OafA/YrhL